MRDVVSVAIGKAVRRIARLRGGGSALPGLVVDRLDPGFLARTLDRLPYGVVVVSGTNGKTTTTKMIVEMLEAQGLRVFTNRTGSNYARGVIAAAVQACGPRGRLRADIAVLELDEAHAAHVVARVRPRVTLLLNVLRDQLDRFGEIDVTARLLQRIADATTDGVVVNREDPLVAAIGARVAAAGSTTVRSFGLSAALRPRFPADGDFHSGALPGLEAEHAPADVVLAEARDGEAVFEIDGDRHRVPLSLGGLYNAVNAAAALTAVRLVHVVGPRAGHEARHADTSTETLLAALAAVRPAFGRGERLELDGQPFELVLVKNPAGFRLALASLEQDPADADAGSGAADPSAVMIAVNDQHADGRDLSWLWDVDFGALAAGGVDTLAGSRAWEMALRLEHDDVPYRRVEEHLPAALAAFRSGTPGRPRRVFCTYTAMLALRRELATLTEVEEVW